MFSPVSHKIKKEGGKTDSLMGKSTFPKTWQPVLDPWDPHGGSSKTSSHKLSSDLRVHAATHLHTYTFTCMYTHATCSKYKCSKFLFNKKNDLATNSTNSSLITWRSHDNTFGRAKCSVLAESAKLEGHRGQHSLHGRTCKCAMCPCMRVWVCVSVHVCYGVYINYVYIWNSNKVVLSVIIILNSIIRIFFALTIMFDLRFNYASDMLK